MLSLVKVFISQRQIPSPDNCFRWGPELVMVWPSAGEN